MAKPKAAGQIAAAREEADGDFQLVMQYVVPIFAEVQGHVMQRYGFVPNDDGFEAFANALKANEASGDAEFIALGAKLKALIKESTAVSSTGSAMKGVNSAAAADDADADEEEDDGEGEGDDDGEGEDDEAEAMDDSTASSMLDDIKNRSK